jgi:hypothetical protein
MVRGGVEVTGQTPGSTVYILASNLDHLFLWPAIFLRRIAIGECDNCGFRTGMNDGTEALMRGIDDCGANTAGALIDRVKQNRYYDGPKYENKFFPYYFSKSRHAVHCRGGLIWRSSSACGRQEIDFPRSTPAARMVFPLLVPAYQILPAAGHSGSRSSAWTCVQRSSSGTLPGQHTGCLAPAEEGCCAGSVFCSGSGSDAASPV